MEENALKPRRFQFRLRTLFVVTAAVAALLSFWNFYIRPQWRAVSVLREQGATVLSEFDDGWSIGCIIPRVDLIRLESDHFSQSQIDALCAIHSIGVVLVPPDTSAEKMAKLQIALPHSEIKTWEVSDCIVP
ncbi:MAG: hypothetical protein K8T91_10375 [Planctomycetes bacterium]|nr:hypothetical protein [Planctomycetota bacterium]